MTKDELIERLNEDLAGEYQAVLMYLTYAATVTGPHRPMLKSFFEAEIPDELAHAQFLAEKISSLGGRPTAEPRPVPSAEGARQMLEKVVAAERKAIEDYRERARQAHELGDSALATHLETVVEAETRHFEETEKILRGW